MRTVLALLFLALPAFAADRFIGWQSCASSGCHGGGKGDDQVGIWRKSDPHSRAYGTLNSARSMRMAEALGLLDSPAQEKGVNLENLKPFKPKAAPNKNDPASFEAVETEDAKAIRAKEPPPTEGESAKPAHPKAAPGKDDPAAFEAVEPGEGKAAPSAPKPGPIKSFKPKTPPAKDDPESFEAVETDEAKAIRAREMEAAKPASGAKPKAGQSTKDDPAAFEAEETPEAKAIRLKEGAKPSGAKAKEAKPSQDDPANFEAVETEQAKAIRMREAQAAKAAGAKPKPMKPSKDDPAGFEAVETEEAKAIAAKEAEAARNAAKPPPEKPLDFDVVQKNPAKPEGVRFSAARNAQCTVCHSPMQSAAPERLAANLKHANFGISCETCHGPAESWLRVHTRPDLTHAQRLAVGVRNLDSHYAKSNTCVGCHANISPEILNAGHPTLRFELARQLVEVTPHWQDFDQKQSAGAWLTSQATLLRELSWLAEKPGAHQSLDDRIDALQWVLDATDLGKHYLAGKSSNAEVRAAADRLARAASAERWNEHSTRAQLERVLALRGDLKSATPQGDFARAEALVPALRGLVLGLDPKVMAQAKAPLDALDLAIRSVTVFDARGFEASIGELAAAIAAKP